MSKARPRDGILWPQEGSSLIQLDFGQRPRRARRIVDAFSAERSDEHREICSRAPAFLEEIAMERRRGRATYTEIGESEADLQRLRTWLERVGARDYFGAAGRAEAEAAVERCAQTFAEFELEALSAEQLEPTRLSRANRCGAPCGPSTMARPE